MIAPDLYAFRELWRQYRNCRRSKRNTRNALAFELDAEAKLLDLQADLRAHRYQPGRSICFVTGGPKPREIFAADFRDRVVHHLLVAHQERVYERLFIHDSYACRKGKGTLAASDRLTHFLHRVTANGHRSAWALKLDVADFFPSIHKRTLYEIVARRIRDPELLWLTRVILFHDPTRDYRFQSRGLRGGAPGTRSYPVPARKSLFAKRNERGLPIGNLPSQFWANVYLNEVDQFIKRVLKARYYVRYVDDMVLLSHDPEELTRWQVEIERFLRERLKLELRRAGREPFAVSRGVDFVGWKTWWNRRVPRRRTLGNLRTRLSSFEREAVRPTWGGRARRVELGLNKPAASVEALRTTLASYSGHLRHGAAITEWQRIWTQFPSLDWLFERDHWALAPRWSLGRAGSFPAHYRKLLRSARKDCLVFLRVGRFVEFYGPQRVRAESVLGLRTVRLPRAGYALTAGFPVRLLAVFESRAHARGLAVVEVREEGRAQARRCRRRVVTSVSVPLSGAAHHAPGTSARTMAGCSRLTGRATSGQQESTSRSPYLPGT